MYINKSNIQITYGCKVVLWFLMFSGLFRYNKSLLGDDLGRFPAPLLMNTVHFTMQAVLSKAITWYWSNRFQSGVTMSWRDYFVKGKYIILSLFISV